MIKSNIRSIKKEKKRLLLSCSKPCLPIFNSSASPRSFPANMKLITSEFHHHFCKACGATGVKIQIQQPNFGLESRFFSPASIKVYYPSPPDQVFQTSCHSSARNDLPKIGVEFPWITEQSVSHVLASLQSHRILPLLLRYVSLCASACNLHHVTPISSEHQNGCWLVACAHPFCGEEPYNKAVAGHYKRGELA